MTVDTRKSLIVCLLCAALFATGCHQDMWNQPKAKAQSKSDRVFEDKSNSRLPVLGTVAYGKARADREFFTGFDKDGHLVKEFPVAVDKELLLRGQERFRIFCTPCHGELGNGKGFIAKRGFTLARPVGNYHSDRLRNMPIGHFYDVMTNGFGVMYPFRSRIKPYDRWAIAAYIRVLQASQYQPLGSIPGEEQQKLELMPQQPSQNATPELPIEAVKPTGDQPSLAPPRGARIVPIGRRPSMATPGKPTDKPQSEPTGGGTAKPEVTKR